MKIFIPTYNRPFADHTCSLLDSEGVDYIVILHDQAQVDLYKTNPRWRSRKKALVDGNVAEVREAVRALVPEGEWALQMDDNIRGFMACEPGFYASHEQLWEGNRESNAGSRAELCPILDVPISFKTFHDRILTECIAEATRRGSPVCSFSAFENPRFRFRKWNDVAYTQNKCVLLRNVGMSWDQSNGHPAMEEYALLAEHLKQFGRVLVNKWARPVAGHYEPGGLGPYEQRLPAKRLACADIMSRYPGLFKNHKDGELLLRWRELEQIKRWRQTVCGGERK